MYNGLPDESVMLGNSIDPGWLSISSTLLISIPSKIQLLCTKIKIFFVLARLCLESNNLDCLLTCTLKEGGGGKTAAPPPDVDGGVSAGSWPSDIVTPIKRHKNQGSTLHFVCDQSTTCQPRQNRFFNIKSQRNPIKKIYRMYGF